jgi:hypothetical protein
VAKYRENEEAVAVWYKTLIGSDGLVVCHFRLEYTNQDRVLQYQEPRHLEPLLSTIWNTPNPTPWDYGRQYAEVWGYGPWVLSGRMDRRTYLKKYPQAVHYVRLGSKAAIKRMLRTYWGPSLHTPPLVSVERSSGD